MRLISEDMTIDVPYDSVTIIIIANETINDCGIRASVINKNVYYDLTREMSYSEVCSEFDSIHRDYINGVKVHYCKGGGK